ncbi:conserved hypothetical protein [Leishmania infantum JPCM5]|uniref:Uncharacterized protein n=2 Tax=Leishmania infantum TaxID=5671 RepID=A4IE35_LEIIN|nr:conserved hypothetical protein [Leishmania infantum JPCM5]CAC9553041.1 hypothetical_protein_-_conserved [Leishmania infantum]CAM73125.1 conserved hypothetical protein [Leishmania infantum JPCM5]SUZ47032.1 hypothetical_protein_-_conserved [Leishmania infantum]|eukprot:XP_001470004.1 conserved hypothetical protein [Leishmania infantum JPCM5]
MSFISYVQSLWGPFTASSDRTLRGGSGASSQQLGSGVWPLSAQVREEMKRGTRYNMKVVLRGTRATGKSTLMARLSGHPLPARYTPSTEIIASTMRLQGELCAPHEGTKVDIWEVVEEGRQRSTSSSSANTGAAMAGHIPTVQLHEALRVAADARLLDMYAGCQLVIFMIDPRQRSSWEYAKQETLHVPPTSCILYALNFSDVEPLTGASGVVRLDEVQAWCNRVRRATTGLVHRVLEGRQAPAEFSVRPMTAMLSAQTGAGMLGVVRALHVASTLVRITAEEVRAQQLFALLARQQAAPIAGFDSTRTPPTGTASAGGARADQAPASGKPPPAEALRAGPHTPASAPPLSLNASAGSSLKTAAHTSMRDTAQASDHPSVAITEVQASTTPALESDSGGLRMQHRSSAVVTTVSNGTSCVNGGGNGTHPQHTSLTRPMSDAEAMRLFLGNIDCDASGQSSPRSSSSSSASGAASSRAWAAAKRPPVEHHFDAATAQLPTLNRTPEGLAQDDSAVANANAGVSGLTPPSLSEELPSPLPAPQVVRPLAEDVVGSLAADMVHDASVSVDDFFAEEGEKDELDGAAPEVDPATPTSAVHQSVDPGSRTARTLRTQRVVPRASIPASAQAAAPDPVLQADVSIILAQMKAALTTDVPIATAGSGPDDAVVRRATELDSAQQEMRLTQRAKKSRHLATGDSEARGNRRHHRKKHRDAADGNAVAAVAEEPEEVDNGSFDLVLV